MAVTMEALTTASILPGCGISSPVRIQILKFHPCPSSSSVRIHHRQSVFSGLRRRVSSSTDPAVAAASNSPDTEEAPPYGSPSPGLYSAKVYDLNAENVNWVLEDVRPYLIADGGNVDVVSVEDGVISLQLQGACGSCPSSTTTMKMGIERVLKEKFGEAVKDIQQVFDDQVTETTVEAVNRHLDILRPAIQNYGGSVEVVSVEGGDCHVRYVGPDSIGSGIKAAIREKYPDIVNIVFIN